MSPTLDDIERRAKVRGYGVWLTNTAIGRRLQVDVGDTFEVWRDLGLETGIHRCGFSHLMPRSILDYLEGRTGREGAARVLSVVSQVAAMEWACVKLNEEYEAERKRRYRENDEARGWDFGGA